MLQPRLSYEILFKNMNTAVPNSGIKLSKPFSSFDALRIMHDEYYSNSGGYKITEVPVGGSFSFNLPFYEGTWYDRSFMMSPLSDGYTLSARARQQCQINETTATTSTRQSWSGLNSIQGSNIHAIYGVKYFDTEPSAENKIYGDRTLLFKNDSIWGNASSGVTSYNLSEPMSSFEFVEFYSNQHFPCYIAPGWAKTICPGYILQSDSNWYYRTTQWSAVNNSKGLRGYRYGQWHITTSARVNDAGYIPALYARNVNFSRIYGVGRK